MKMTFIVALMAILAVGCDQQQQASRDTSAEKDNVQESVKEAKAEVDKQAKAQKEILDAEAKAAQAKLDAEKARAQAEATDAQSKVDAASQAIRDAAGAASTKSQTETGAGTTTVTAPPAETTTPATAESDQKLTEQVRTAVLGGGDNNAGAQTIQISVSGGTATLTGTVKSDAEKAQAEQKAKAVAGVTRVDNQLQVKAE